MSWSNTDGGVKVSHIRILDDSKSQALKVKTWWVWVPDIVWHYNKTCFQLFSWVSTRCFQNIPAHTIEIILGFPVGALSPLVRLRRDAWVQTGFPTFFSVAVADWTGKDLLRLQTNKCLVGTIFPLEQCINNLMGLFPAVVVEPIFVPISSWSNIFRSFFETICIRVYLSLALDLSLHFFHIALTFRKRGSLITALW